MTATDTDTPLRRTPLYQAHKALGARLIEFGGWDMPVQYKPGLVKEHKAVRSTVGMFDVSHMGEAILAGPRAAEAVQRLVTGNVGKMADGAAMYTVMCYEHGGIVDDCIVYRRAADDYLIILNASNVAKDLAWIRDNTQSRYGVEIRDESDATALIAVQGPRAVALVAGLAQGDLAATKPFCFAITEVAGVPCMAARTGYTGEDGFEMACPAERAEALWNAVLEAGGDDILPCGLGARDTLRLEARLSLYGNDIDETTSPYEAGLGWVVKPDAGDFIGKEAILAAKAAGLSRKLVGFVVSGRGIPRSGYPIVDRRREGDPVVGNVTSGTKGISVDGAIGLGYVPKALSKTGTEITIDCRGKDVVATVVKGKFYQRST